MISQLEAQQMVSAAVWISEPAMVPRAVAYLSLLDLAVLMKAGMWNFSVEMVEAYLLPAQTVPRKLAALRS